MARGAKVLYWILVAGWAAVIFRFSALPGSALPGRIPSEIGHLGEYFVLGGLLYLALRQDLTAGRAIAIAVILASLYGITDEFHQHFVPTRTPDPYDWGMDTVGALAGALAAYALARLIGRRRAEKPAAPSMPQ